MKFLASLGLVLVFGGTSFGQAGQARGGQARGSGAVAGQGAGGIHSGPTRMAPAGTLGAHSFYGGAGTRFSPTLGSPTYTGRNFQDGAIRPGPMVQSRVLAPGTYGSRTWGSGAYYGAGGIHGGNRTGYGAIRGNISPYRGIYGAYGRNYGAYGSGRIVSPYYGSRGGGTYGTNHSGGWGHGYNNWNNHPWDHRHDYAWNHHHYHWSGDQWLVIDSDPYYYSYDGPIGGIDYGGGYDSEPAMAETDPGSGSGSVTVESNGGSLTVDVQRALARSGYYDGDIDGILGPATRDAIAKFQADQGLDSNGRITGALIRTLGL